MIKPTDQLLEEAKEDLAEIIDYVASETADVSLLLWLQDLELKFGTIYRRLSHPVVQQEIRLEYSISTARKETKDVYLRSNKEYV